MTSYSQKIEEKLGRPLNDDDLSLLEQLIDNIALEKGEKASDNKKEHINSLFEMIVDKYAIGENNIDQFTDLFIEISERGDERLRQDLESRFLEISERGDEKLRKNIETIHRKEKESEPSIIDRVGRTITSGAYMGVEWVTGHLIEMSIGCVVSLGCAAVPLVFSGVVSGSKLLYNKYQEDRSQYYIDRIEGNVIDEGQYIRNYTLFGRTFKDILSYTFYIESVDNEVYTFDVISRDNNLEINKRCMADFIHIGDNFIFDQEFDKRDDHMIYLDSVYDLRKIKVNGRRPLHCSD